MSKGRKKFLCYYSASVVYKVLTECPFSHLCYRLFAQKRHRENKCQNYHVLPVSDMNSYVCIIPPGTFPIALYANVKKYPNGPYSKLVMKASSCTGFNARFPVQTTEKTRFLLRAQGMDENKEFCIYCDSENPDCLMDELRLSMVAYTCWQQQHLGQNRRVGTITDRHD